VEERKKEKLKRIEDAAKRFEKFYRQPVSKRISDFLKEEGRRERELSKNQNKKTAYPAASDDLES
jgi:hypothetical protein